MRRGKDGSPAPSGVARWVAPALVSAVLAVGLSGCGVPPSEVVEVGEPATGMVPATEVYFFARDAGVPEPPGAASSPGGRAPDGDGEPTADASGAPESATPRPMAGPGSLHGVPRPAATGTDPVSYAVRRLLAGPTPAEAKGLTTALPRPKDPSRVTTETDRRARTIVIHFPAGTGLLTEPALYQLACTAARADRVRREADGEKAARATTAPTPTTDAVPLRPDPVEIRVTDRQRAGDGKAGDGWTVTVPHDTCPS
jgi:hypothetical protein